MLNTYLTPYVYNRRNSFPLDSLLADFAGFDGLNSWLSTLNDSQFVEKDGVYSTEIELAGYKKEEVSVEVSEDGFVTVTAENKKRGKITRQIYLSDVDAEKIEAKLEDGFLSLSLPKHPEALPKRIEVK